MHIIKIHQEHKNQPFQHHFLCLWCLFLLYVTAFDVFIPFSLHFLSIFFTLTEFRFADNIIEQLPGEMSNISKILNVPVEPSLQSTTAELTPISIHHFTQLSCLQRNFVRQGATTTRNQRRFCCLFLTLRSLFYAGIIYLFTCELICLFISGRMYIS